MLCDFSRTRRGLTLLRPALLHRPSTASYSILSIPSEALHIHSAPNFFSRWLFAVEDILVGYTGAIILLSFILAFFPHGPAPSWPHPP
jgi:hypothetical protein